MAKTIKKRLDTPHFWTQCFLGQTNFLSEGAYSILHCLKIKKNHDKTLPKQHLIIFNSISITQFVLVILIIPSQVSYRKQISQGQSNKIDVKNLLSV